MSLDEQMKKAAKSAKAKWAKLIFIIYYFDEAGIELFHTGNKEALKRAKAYNDHNKNLDEENIGIEDVRWPAIGNTQRDNLKRLFDLRFKHSSYIYKEKFAKAESRGFKEHYSEFFEFVPILSQYVDYLEEPKHTWHSMGEFALFLYLLKDTKEDGFIITETSNLENLAERYGYDLTNNWKSLGASIRACFTNSKANPGNEANLIRVMDRLKNMGFKNTHSKASNLLYTLQIQ